VAWPDVQITSSQNPRVKVLRSLRLRKYRQREGRFLVEGIRIVEEALTCGAPVETLVYAPELLVSERAQALAQGITPAQRLALSAQVFRTLSDREDPQGIAAVVRIEERSLADIPLTEDLLVLVAYQLRDPGNLGTIIRTADAAGATGVVAVEPSVDLYDPQTVRATMGSLFALPIVRLDDETPLIHWYHDLRAAGLPLLVVASSAHGQRLYYEVDYRRPLVLLLGNERYGLPTPIRKQADVLVRLPMAGRATSLNVSAAAAALVYEVIRQRTMPVDPAAETGPASVPDVEIGHG
jgi:TrmH family RNA methyltransferase